MLLILAVLLGDFPGVHVHVAVEHVVLFLAEHIVPGTLVLVLLPVGGPVPVALNDLVGRARADFAALDGAASDVVGDFLHAKVIPVPHAKVAGAVLGEAVPGPAAGDAVAGIGGTLEYFHAAGVGVQRPPLGRGDGSVMRAGSALSPEGGPAIVDRVKVVVFVHVHGIGQPDLILVAGAFLLMGLGLGPSEGGQQQGGQNGDDDQQPDQRETAALGLGCRRALAHSHTGERE